MIANERATNAIDFYEARQIADAIRKYETNSGMEVRKIATVPDSECTYYSDESKFHNYQLGARIMAVDYSNYRLIASIMNRVYEKVEMPIEIYNQYYSGKNWKFLNLDEQCIFVGDTMYLAIY